MENTRACPIPGFACCKNMAMLGCVLPDEKPVAVSAAKPGDVGLAVVGPRVLRIDFGPTTAERLVA